MLANQEADKIATEKIRSFSGTLIATSENGKVYAKSYELNGFNFMQFSIIAPFYIETSKGCTVTFYSDQEMLDIESDTLEILSDVSNTLNLALTEFEIEIEQELTSFIPTSGVIEIAFIFKSTKEIFRVTDLSRLNKLIETVPNKG